MARSTVRKAPSAGGARNRATAAVSRPELLVDGSDQQFNRMVLGLFTLRAMLHSMREKLAEAVGLGGIEYIALVTLARLSDGDIGVQELADRLRLSGAFTTSTINVLVSKGLVAKTGHPTDKRRVRLTVTTRGEDLLDRFAPMQQQVNDVAFEPLTATQFHQLRDIIAKLSQSTERAMALQEYLLKAERGPARRSEGGRRRAA